MAQKKYKGKNELMKITSTMKKDKELVVAAVNQETDIDVLSIPEEKTGTKRHSGAFPREESPKQLVEAKSIQMEFDDS